MNQTYTLRVFKEKKGWHWELSFQTKPVARSLGYGHSTPANAVNAYIRLNTVSFNLVEETPPRKPPKQAGWGRAKQPTRD